ncbi:hypothetical protein [Rahnella inusitata]|uniref:Type VI secretion system tube protein Hcp n=2 Tax=Rahnella inusitata TaxID=58169 RepID=A0ABX9P035_9GAMM|nr:hypothetical protein [Rahnella inusitata]RJT12762.1 hypothetical protein D5396_12310 [Rahnella inusitata]
MAKLQECQFVQISIDGKAVKGSSEEAGYKEWMEGFAPSGLSTYSGQDGAMFDSCHISLQVTKETSNLYEKYLQRGYKDLTITIVHRSSDHYKEDYECQRTVYHNCKISTMNFEKRDQLFLNMSFSFEGAVEVTFYAPNADETALDQIGPIKYDIPKKALV